MPAFAKTVNTQVATDVSVPTTTETVVATVAGINTGPTRAKVLLRGWVQLTTGTNTTAVTVRVRRGTDATGTLVGEANPITIPTAAGSTDDYSINVQDVPGEVAGQSYVLTVQQTAATANGSAVQASLRAEITG